MIRIANDTLFTDIVYTDTTFSYSDTTILGYAPQSVKYDSIYYWSVKACNNENECSGWSEYFMYQVIPFESVNNNVINSSISIYPNPSTGSFAILSESEHIKGIRIYDVKGVAVAFERSGEECALTKPVAGTYFVEVSLQGGEKVVKKIVVE